MRVALHPPSQLPQSPFVEFLDELLDCQRPVDLENHFNHEFP